MTPKRILLVSGPSGGGKSTFIRQLHERSLAPEILKDLPENSANWPVIEINDVVKGKLALESFPTDASGVLLHYDIVFIHRYRIPRYEDDPALAALKNAESLRVVFVRPESAVVRRQFLDRQTRQREAKSAASLLWSRFFRLPMRRLLSPLTGKPTLSTEKLYRDDKWLAACYHQWETFLRHTVARHPDANLTIIEPTDEGCSFRLHPLSLS